MKAFRNTGDIKARGRRKAPILAGMIAAASMAAAGFGGLGASASVKPHKAVYNVTLGVGTVIETGAPLYDALQYGFFVKHGINVTLDTLSATSLTASALESGSIQAVYGASIASAEQSLSGSPTVMFVSSNDDSNLLLCMRPAYASSHNVTSSDSVGMIMAALSGAKVGIQSPNSNQDLIGRYDMKKYGNLTGSQYTVENLGSQSALVAAFQRGSIDASFISPPLCEELAAAGEGEVMINPDRMIDVAGNGLYTTTAYAKSHKAILKALAAAMVEGDAFSVAHSQATVQAMEQYFPTVSPSILLNGFNAVIRPTIKKNGTQTRQGWITASQVIYPTTNQVLNTKEGLLWTNSYLPS